MKMDLEKNTRFSNELDEEIFGQTPRQNNQWLM